MHYNDKDTTFIYLDFVHKIQYTSYAPKDLPFCLKPLIPLVLKGIKFFFFNLKKREYLRHYSFGIAFFFGKVKLSNFNFEANLAILIPYLNLGIIVL